jgi:hypothetical protein
MTPTPREVLEADQHIRTASWVAPLRARPFLWIAKKCVAIAKRVS